jgi:hypothetical protein
LNEYTLLDASRPMSRRPADVIKRLVKHPLTDAGLAKFTAEWAAAGQSIL